MASGKNVPENPRSLIYGGLDAVCTLKPLQFRRFRDTPNCQSSATFRDLQPFATLPLSERAVSDASRNCSQQVHNRSPFVTPLVPMRDRQFLFRENSDPSTEHSGSHRGHPNPDRNQIIPTTIKSGPYMEHPATKTEMSTPPRNSPSSLSIPLPANHQLVLRHPAKPNLHPDLSASLFSSVFQLPTAQGFRKKSKSTARSLLLSLSGSSRHSPFSASATHS